MDTNNWRPAAQGGEQVTMDGGGGGGDWRNQLQQDSRQRIVNNIMETLKRHLPFSGPEGLQELKKIAVRFEEKIYTAATSQSDYLRKISLKMLTMETKSQNPMGNHLQTNSASNSKNPPDPDFRMASQSTVEKGHWDVESNGIFIDLCVELVNAGHRPGTHFNKLGWEELGSKLAIASGTSYTRPQLKNHWDALRRDWQTWQNLVGGEHELVLDRLTGAITASEDWWRNKLQRHPEARKFRYKPLQFAYEMEILFSGSSVELI